MHEPTLGHEKLYSDARCHIPGVTAVKQSQEGTPLSDTYSDARCHIPGVTTDKQNIQEASRVNKLEHSWLIWGFFYQSHLWGW